MSASPSSGMYFFIDESGFGRDGISLLSCVATDDPGSLRTNIQKLKEDILHDPRLAGILGNFSADGFHYADNHYEIRNRFIELLSRLTFEAYICFIESGEGVHRNELYDRMFGRLLYERLRGNRDKPLTVCFEQHDSRQKKRLNELKQIVFRIYGSVNQFQHMSDVSAPQVITAGKDEQCLSIADYTCSIFKKYYEKMCLGKKKGEEPLEKRNFDDLRGKIRLIHDLNIDVFYSRRNPFPDIA